MRASLITRQRYRTILGYSGLVLCLAALLMLIPLLALLWAPGEWRHSWGFLVPALLLGGLGAALWRLLRPLTPAVLTVQEGGIIVLVCWVAVCLFSALPFVAVEKLTPAHAVFEAVSGWTTTGLSVVDVSSSSRLILLWRSIMQLAGGAGLAIIMLASIAGPLGPGLALAEGRGQQLAPHVRASVRIVAVMYAGYAFLGTLAYWAAGMSAFDALNHSFCAVSTGGFSTHPESIAYWDSPAVDAVSLPLMLLGSTNFLTAYSLLHGGVRATLRNGELRLTAALLPLCSLLLLLLVCRGLYPTFGKSLRVALFETTSALTTTGFSSTVYAQWAPVGLVLLTVLMIVGGGAGSTAGGIKQYRVHLLLKSVAWDLRRALLPRAAVVENYIWQGDRRDFVNDARLREAATFALLYLAAYAVACCVIAAHGFTFDQASFEAASALGTVGLSLGVTGASCPPAVLWTEALCMFLGRLEFTVVLVSCARLARDLLAAVR